MKIIRIKKRCLVDHNNSLFEEAIKQINIPTCSIFLEEGKNASHEWLIEFEKEPESIEYFTEILDNALKSLNSDYEAKRYHSLMLHLPIVRSVPKNTFYNWLKSKGKLGGQHKVPCLSNDRKYVEEIMAISLLG